MPLKTAGWTLDPSPTWHESVRAGDRLRFGYKVTNNDKKLWLWVTEVSFAKPMQYGNASLDQFSLPVLSPLGVYQVATYRAGPVDNHQALVELSFSGSAPLGYVFKTQVKVCAFWYVQDPNDAGTTASKPLNESGDCKLADVQVEVR